MDEETDTFWYHECPHTGKKVYLPVDWKCPDCVLANMNKETKETHSGKLTTEGE